MQEISALFSEFLASSLNFFSGPKIIFSMYIIGSLGITCFDRGFSEAERAEYPYLPGILELMDFPLAFKVP